MTSSSLARCAAVSAFALVLGLALAPIAMADDYTSQPGQSQTAQQGSPQSQPENGEGEPVDPRTGTVLPGAPSTGY